jgi:hypothetical protein
MHAEMQKSQGSIMSILRIGMVTTGLAWLSLAAPTYARSEADVSGATVEAVWRVQSLDFAYRGYSTAYSCSSLRERVRAILQTLGARDTMTVTTWACSDPSYSARVQITLASPVEATPENVEALTTYDSKTELIARVRKEQLDTAADIERFPAVWKTISLAREPGLDLSPGDCELVQQLRRDVLPRLSIRVLRDNLHCSNAFGNVGKPRLSVAALVAVNADRAR